eukprot:s255_g17.t1
MFDQIGPEGAPLAVAPEGLEELEIVVEDPLPAVPRERGFEEQLPQILVGSLLLRALDWVLNQERRLRRVSRLEPGQWHRREEIKNTGPRVPRLLEGMSWASDAAETVTLSEIVTSPDILDAEINSVKFEQSGLGSERVPLGGTHVLLWKPSGGVDDASFEELPGPLVFEGMLEEIGNLERCRTGLGYWISSETRLQLANSQP